MNKKETAPYISFSTFKNVIDDLKKKSLPSNIDSSILQTLSGTNKALLISTFRFFKLIESDNQPTSKMKELHSANPEKTKAILKQLLENGYGEIIPLIQNGTPDAVKKKLADIFEVPSSSLKNSYNFLIGLSQEVGVPISSHLLTKKGKNSGLRKPTRRRLPKKNVPDISNQHFDRNEALKSDDGLKEIPIPLGFKIWKVKVEENYTNDELIRFIEMIKMALTK